MGVHIILPASHFKSGENTITMDFETGVATANRPLIRYQDRDDGSEYIYTLFVPMDASLAFPCFDQPDLKARFTLDITAPRNWAIISNTSHSDEAVRVNQDSLRRIFDETKPISTYLFAFGAGPFKQVRTSPNGLRLLVRQSKLQRAKEEWPEVERLTSKGIRLMTEF